MDLIADSHVPKYAQIADIFRQRIARGIWAKGMREVEIARIGDVGERSEYIRRNEQRVRSLQRVRSRQDHCELRCPDSVGPAVSRRFSIRWANIGLRP